MSPSISTNKLTKKYADTASPALDNLTLTIQPGEVYGFLGANGAGKSTTIRLLMNFLQPTSGSARIAGLDVVSDSVKVKRHVGYLAGDVALYPKTTGRDLLNYLSALQGGVDRSYRRKLEKRFEAEVDKPIRSLSKGNRQKIGILQAFMHQPDVLILDEPTSGLDPLMQEAFYDTIHEARNRGAAVLMSSHNLAETQRACDRIGIIKHGTLIREQTIGGDDQLGKMIFRVVVASANDAAKLKKTASLKVLSVDGTTLVVQPSGNLAESLTALGQHNILELATQQLNLEDEFMGFYGDDQ